MHRMMAQQGIGHPLRHSLLLPAPQQHRDDVPINSDQYASNDEDT